MQMMQIVLAAAIMCGIDSRAKLEWQSHYQQAKKTAHQSQRPMLIVLENPRRSETSFDETMLAGQHKQVELMRNYLLCKIDVTTPYGKRVAAALRADRFPYTLITDKTATYITFRQAGKMSSEQWCLNLEMHKQGSAKMPASGTVAADRPVPSAGMGQPMGGTPASPQPILFQPYSFLLPTQFG
jgi:hypothetical protein